MNGADFMRRALALAKRGRTSPNPRVGAVVVRDGRNIGEGFHPRAGEPHAEVLALQAAGEDARGAYLYVTLEPCCHQGRTPPCTDAVIGAGIVRVFAAMADPDPNVAGKGFERLRQAGVQVECGLCGNEARRLNEAYIKHRTTGMPFVILKSAMSLDGRIATRTGDSKWITGEKARAYAHRVRSEVDAILVGANTLRADDPALTARLGRKVYYPARVVVTSTGDVPSGAKLLDSPGDTIIAATKSALGDALMKLERSGARILTLGERNGRPSMRELMRELGSLGYLSVLIEGGGEVAASALDERIVDKVLYFYAPRIIGGREAVPAVGGLGCADVASSIRVEHIRTRRLGEDILVEGYVRY